MAGLSVIILTKNESLHLARAIASVQSIADQVYVVDSFSTDDTVDIGRKCGAIVLENEFVNQAAQFNWALDHCGIESGWILRLDADEIIEPDLQEELRAKIPHLSNDIVGVNLKRKHIFMDRWVKYGGRYPLMMTRLFRAGCGRSEERWMDEHIAISGGRTVTFNGGFVDHNLNGLSHFTAKHNAYATREAVEVLGQRYRLFDREFGSRALGSNSVSVKRLAKERIYNRIPFAISSAAYFIYRYVFLLGFLDGRSGLVYHFLQGFWYRFLVGAKVMELERVIAGLATKEEISAKLEQVTGLQLR